MSPKSYAAENGLYIKPGCEVGYDDILNEWNKINDEMSKQAKKQYYIRITKIIMYNLCMLGFMLYILKLL